MGIVDRLRTRLSGLDQRWFDLALAAAIAVWFAVELLTRDPEGTDQLATAVTGGVIVLALVWRSRHLVAVCLVFVVGVLLQHPLGGGYLQYLDSSYAVLFTLLYTVGRRTDGWTTVGLCVLLWAATSFALSVPEDEPAVIELFWGLGLCTPPVLAGERCAAIVACATSCTPPSAASPECRPRVPRGRWTTSGRGSPPSCRRCWPTT